MLKPDDGKTKTVHGETDGHNVMEADNNETDIGGKENPDLLKGCAGNADERETVDVDEGDEVVEEDAPDDDVTEDVKGEILAALGFANDEEEEEEDEEAIDLGEEYGATIAIPEGETISVKGETCCHGFRLVMGAILVYTVLAVHSNLIGDIATILYNEYATEYMNDFNSQFARVPVAPSYGMDTSDYLAGSDFYNDNYNNDINNDDRYNNDIINDDQYNNDIYNNDVNSDNSNTSSDQTLSRQKRQTPEQVQAFYDNVEDTKADIDKIIDVYEKTKGLMGLVSSVLVVFLDYRKVIGIGSIINIAAFLIATFVQNYQVLVFLLGFCTGFGHNLLYVATTVAVLERFRKHRELANSLATTITALATLVIMLLKSFVFGDVGLTTSKSYRGLLAVLFGLCFLAALLIQPLRINMKEGGASFVAASLGITGLRMFKAWGIYVLAGIVFFYSYSTEAPIDNILSIAEDQNPNSISIAAKCGSMTGLSVLFVLLGGCCICCRCCRCCTREECCCSRCVNGCIRSLRVNQLTIIVAIMCFVAGLNCFFVLGMSDDGAGYAFAYSSIFGTANGIVDPLLKVVIPIVLGEEFITLGVGVTNFAGGLALVISGEAAEQLVKKSEAKAIFYTGIATFTIAGILALVLHRLHRFGLIVPVDSNQMEPETDASHVPDDANSQIQMDDVTNGDMEDKDVELGKSTNIENNHSSTIYDISGSNFVGVYKRNLNGKSDDSEVENLSSSPSKLTIRF